MTKNNMTVHQLSESQLEMVTGGISFSGFMGKIKRAASVAWDLTKIAAGAVADAIGSIGG